MKRLLVALLVLGSVTAAGLVAATPAQAARKAPTYSAWSDYIFDMRARAAAPTRKQGRLYIQVNRNGNPSGDRQVMFKRRVQGRAEAVSGIRTLAPGATVTFNSGVVPCGKSVSATLYARGRANANAAWTDWKSISATLRRSC